MSETDLVIDGIYIPPYAARNLSQTLDPIDDAGVLQYTINGTLLDLSDSNFQKYRSTISCTDHQLPALNGVWPGRLVTVHCISRLYYLTASGLPDREVVPGSSEVQGDYTFYRPKLTMRVESYSTSREEWQARNAWTLNLLEA